jgi:hypothetical protein
MESANFTSMLRSIAKADLDFDTLALKVLLVTSSLSAANLDNWTTYADVDNEVVGSGYMAGGASQAFTLGTLDRVNRRQPITYATIDSAWLVGSFAAAGAIIYKPTDILMHYIDFGGIKVCSAEPFVLTYDSPFYIQR